MPAPSNIINLNHIYVIERSIAIAKIDHPKVLDYGCRRGHMVAAARERSLNYYGVDPYFERGDQWRSHLMPNAEGFCDRIVEGRIPHDDDSFDVVVSSQAFEHVQDAEAALIEIRRVLKPGGAFLAIFLSKNIRHEVHAKIYFVHWLNCSLVFQKLYSRAGLHLGFGFENGRKKLDASGWTEKTQKYLKTSIVYRGKSEIYKLWSSVFGAEPKSNSLEFFKFRIHNTGFKKIAFLVDVPGVSAVCRWIAVKRLSCPLIVWT